MATATTTTTSKTIITLKMGPKEAQTLYDIVRMISGHPVKSRRGYADAIYHALQEISPPYTTSYDPDSDRTGSIHFKDC